jgi:hypothetical protein
MSGGTTPSPLGVAVREAAREGSLDKLQRAVGVCLSQATQQRRSGMMTTGITQAVHEALADEYVVAALSCPRAACALLNELRPAPRTVGGVTQGETPLDADAAQLAARLIASAVGAHPCWPVELLQAYLDDLTGERRWALAPPAAEIHNAIEASLSLGDSPGRRAPPQLPGRRAFDLEPPAPLSPRPGGPDAEATARGAGGVGGAMAAAAGLAGAGHKRARPAPPPAPSLGAKGAAGAPPLASQAKRRRKDQDNGLPEAPAPPPGVRVYERVWARFADGLWWPAELLRTRDAVDEVARAFRKETPFLVRFFGGGSFAWAAARDLVAFDPQASAVTSGGGLEPRPKEKRVQREMSQAIDAALHWSGSEEAAGGEADAEASAAPAAAAPAPAPAPASASASASASVSVCLYFLSLFLSLTVAIGTVS